jgi:hypothetical protein
MVGIFNDYRTDFCNRRNSFDTYSRHPNGMMLIFGLGGHDASMDSDVSGLDGGIGDSLDTGMDTDFDASFDAHGIDSASFDDIDSDGDFDAQHDGHFDQHDSAEGYADQGLRLFTVRGFIAFFTIFGWSGLVCLQAGMSSVPTFLIAFAAGAASMTVMAWILKASMKLAFNGTMNLANAVGKTAEVYLRVPQKRGGRGKVNVLVQEQYTEADAVTDEDFDLMPGTEVLVIGLTAPTTLLVRAKKQK